MLGSCSKGVIWITGLSGAGKSTLAKQISRILKVEGKKTLLLDGDNLRKEWGFPAKFHNNNNLEARLALAKKYSLLCKNYADENYIVIIATISMFHNIYKWNRANLPNYFEVYLKVSLDELRRRDAKQLYSRFDSGQIRNVVGLDLAFDEPEMPDMILLSDKNTQVTDLADLLIEGWRLKRIV